jgi:hypothetical protein
MRRPKITASGVNVTGETVFSCSPDRSPRQAFAENEC